MAKKWFKVAIIGSRRRNAPADAKKIEETFFQLLEDRNIHPRDAMIVSGGAKGPDTFGEKLADRHSIAKMIFPARWKDLEAEGAMIKSRGAYKYNLMAGFDRNSFIVDEADAIIAAVAEDRKGGTEDSIKKADKEKIILC